MTYIIQSNGLPFYINDLDRNVIERTITIESISHSLAHLCRFTGHTKRFYSVAQHSVHVSHLVPLEYGIDGLLHDVSEAIVGDLSTPIKHLCGDYRRLCYRVEEFMSEVFGTRYPVPDCVKRADLIALATERRDLLPKTCDEWPILQGVQPARATIEPWSPDLAEKMFLDRYYALRITDTKYSLSAGAA